MIGGDSDAEGIWPEGEGQDVVTGGVMAGALKGEPERTLGEARFVIGDYVDCAVFEPLGDGSVAAAPRRGEYGGSVSGRGGGGGGGGYGGPPRENGYGRGRGGMRGGYGGGAGGGGRLGEGVPTGEWRRGERIPDGRGYGGGYGRGRGRGY